MQNLEISLVFYGNNDIDIIFSRIMQHNIYINSANVTMSFFWILALHRFIPYFRRRLRLKDWHLSLWTHNRSKYTCSSVNQIMEKGWCYLETADINQIVTYLWTSDSTFFNPGNERIAICSIKYCKNLPHKLHLWDCWAFF